MNTVTFDSCTMDKEASIIGVNKEGVKLSVTQKNAFTVSGTNDATIEKLTVSLSSSGQFVSSKPTGTGALFDLTITGEENDLLPKAAVSLQTGNIQMDSVTFHHRKMERVQQWRFLNHSLKSRYGTQLAPQTLHVPKLPAPFFLCQLKGRPSSFQLTSATSTTPPTHPNNLRNVLIRCPCATDSILPLSPPTTTNISLFSGTIDPYKDS